MILSVYDLSGIQEYIFSSNKLRDICGGSEKVKSILDSELKEIIKKYLNTNTDWEKKEKIKIFSEGLDAEIYYSGGGNAVVLYRNETIMKHVNGQLSKKILLEIPGIKIYTKSKSVDNLESVNKNIKELFLEIKKEKNEKIRINEIKGISIVKKCSFTGKMAYTMDEDQAISYEIQNRRNTIQNENKNYKEIDDLFFEKGNNRYIGVVHIDGNSFGDKLEKIFEKSSNKVRTFSLNIQKAFENAYTNMQKKVMDYINLVCKNNKVDNKEDKSFNYFKSKKDAPFIKILINGDEATYICNGMFAIDSAEIFLDELKKQFSEENNDLNLTACAGVALVKPHFPFSQAYNLAESCCAKAKLKGKVEEKEEIGFWLDFHIQKSGIYKSLSEEREQNYKPFESSKEYRMYKLLARPYRLEKSKNEKWYDFAVFKKIIDAYRKNLNDENENLSKKRLYDLFEAFFENSEQIFIKSKYFESRGIDIIKECNLEDKGVDKKTFYYKTPEITPFFDPIETMDFYHNVLEYVDRGEIQ